MDSIVGLIAMAVMLGIFIFWVWSLIDILKSDFKNDVNKIVWLLVVFFLYAIGAVLYYFIGRNQKS
jgi:hypothetical protein